MRLPAVPLAATRLTRYLADMNVIILMLFALPFALQAVTVQMGVNPWAGAGVGYAIILFLLWCFRNDG